MNFTTKLNNFNDIIEAIKEDGRAHSKYTIDGFWSDSSVDLRIYFGYPCKINYDIGCSSGGNNGDNVAMEMLNKAAALEHAALLIDECYGREDELVAAYEFWKDEALAEA